MTRKDTIEKLLKEHNRRLHLFEVQQAKLGLDTPQKILIEIEHIKKFIKDLKVELAALRERETQAHPKNTLLRGRYKIEDIISVGGMGVIYLALDTDFDELVAIKENTVSNNPTINRQASLEQFKQEAKILRSLSHKNLPNVMASFIDQERQYLVMQYIEGQNLGDILEATHNPLPIHKALTYIIQVCQAVTYLHGQTPPIIHRDIKPHNIIITPHQHVYLVDFGLAKQGSDGSYTRLGAIGGTPGYAPPEQFSSRSRSTPAVDIYALGATLYTLVTAIEPPESTDIMSGLTELTPPNIINPTLNEEITQAITHAMQIRVIDRPASVADWQSELSRLHQNLITQPKKRNEKAESGRQKTENREQKTENNNQETNDLLLQFGFIIILVLLTCIFFIYYGINNFNPSLTSVTYTLTPTRPPTLSSTPTDIIYEIWVTDENDNPLEDAIVNMSVPKNSSRQDASSNNGLARLSIPSDWDGKAATMRIVKEGYKTYHNQNLTLNFSVPLDPIKLKKIADQLESTPTNTSVTFTNTSTPTSISHTPTSTPNLGETATVAFIQTQEAKPTNTPIPTATNTLAPVVTVTPDETTLPQTMTASDGATMVLIPAGPFLMGSEPEVGLAACQKLRIGSEDDCELSWFEDEAPAHTVTLDAFYIDQYEVTNVQYAIFLNQQGNQIEGDVTWLDATNSSVRIHQQKDVWQADDSYGNHPVIEVTWYGAKAYCNWRDNRLPTEAEWEKAARGPDGYQYPWGNEFDGTRLNFCDKNCLTGWANTDYDDGYIGTAPVGSYSTGVSLYGVYDMAGNVWEWTSTIYVDYPFHVQDEWHEVYLNRPDIRVLRSGSWGIFGNDTRTAYRSKDNPTNSFNHYGFRCAADVSKVSGL